MADAATIASGAPTLLVDPPAMALAGSPAVDESDTDVGLYGGEIGTDCAQAIAVEPRNGGAALGGGFNFVANVGSVVSSFACCSVASLSKPKSYANGSVVILPHSNGSACGMIVGCCNGTVVGGGCIVVDDDDGEEVIASFGHVVLGGAGGGTNCVWRRWRRSSF
jgi:hypothetical protein